MFKVFWADSVREDEWAQSPAVTESYPKQEVCVSFIRGAGSAHPDQFKKKYPDCLVTAHPLPRHNTTILPAQAFEALYIMKGTLTVEAKGQRYEMAVGDTLGVQNASQIVVTVTSDTGAFFLKASKKAASDSQAA